jgi:hypothetical protein
MAKELTPDEAKKLKAKIDEMRVYIERLEQRADARGMVYDPRSTENFRAHLHNVENALQSLWMYLHYRSAGSATTPGASPPPPTPNSSSHQRALLFRPKGPPQKPEA